MATTESGGAGMVACPLCDDYIGEPSSVEAHISCMTDEAHKGEVGRAHRDDLEPELLGGREATTDDDQQDSSGSDASTTETREYPSVDGGPQSEDREQETDDRGSEMPTTEELQRQREQQSGEPDESDDTDDTDDTDEVTEEIEEDTDDGMGGIPLPCSTTTLAVGVVLALAVVWWMTRDSGESGQQADQQEERVPNAPTGGLIGGD